MKASLKIEAIGDNADQMCRFYRCLTNSMVPGLGDITFGKSFKSYWVAQITGFDKQYKYQRVFLRGKKSYKYANSKGSRGVYVYYLLESGNIYDVRDPSLRKERYFCTVNGDGDIIKIDKEEVDQWINEHSESMS